MEFVLGLIGIVFLLGAGVVVLRIVAGIVSGASMMASGLVHFISGIYNFIDKSISWLVSPFKKLFKWIKHMCARNNLRIYPKSWNRRFKVFGNFGSFLIFVAAFAFVGGSFLVEYLNGSDLEMMVEDIVYSTTVGAIIGIFDGGLDFSAATMFAIAFSGFLFDVCMDSLGRAKHWYERWYVRFPAFVLYLSATAFLALMLSDFFDVVGAWGSEALTSLLTTDAQDFVSGVGWVIGLIVLSYVGLILLLISIKEYAESLLFGSGGMIVLMAVVYLLDNYTELSSDEYQLLYLGIGLVIILATEAIRMYCVNKRHRLNVPDDDDDEDDDEDEEEVIVRRPEPKKPAPQPRPTPQPRPAPQPRPTPPPQPQPRPSAPSKPPAAPTPAPVSKSDADIIAELERLAKK